MLLWQLSRFTALSGLRGRPTGPDGSHLVLMPPPSLGGGGSGGGSRGPGGPVGSFARTSLSHSSLQRHAPRHAPVPKSMYLVFRKQTISACHRQLYTPLITASHRWKVLEHYLPVMAGYGRIRPEGTCVHPDEFLRSRVTGQSTSGSASVFGFVTDFGFVTSGQNQS